MLRLSKISLGKKVYVCVWRVQCQGRHRQTRQKLTKGRERCGRERVSEEGGRKERHKSDQQTKSHLAEKNRLFSEIMLLENSARREARQARQLGVKQRPGFHYHQMVLAPPDRTRNWDIESLSQGNPLLCILEVQPASLGGISQKKKKSHRSHSRSHSSSSTVRHSIWDLHFSWHFLMPPQDPAGWAGSHCQLCLRDTADPGGESLPMVFFSWVFLAKLIGSFDFHVIIAIL